MALDRRIRQHFPANRFVKRPQRVAQRLGPLADLVERTQLVAGGFAHRPKHTARSRAVSRRIRGK